MREISALNNYVINQSAIKLDEANKELIGHFNRLIDVMNGASVVRVDKDITPDALKKFKRILDGWYTLGSDRYDAMRTMFKNVANKSPNTIPLDSSQGRLISGGGVETTRSDASIIAKEVVKILDRIPAQSPADLPKKVYIPVLRGLRKFDKTGNDIYKEQTIKDYFEPTTNSTPEIFTGLGLFESLVHLKLGDSSEQDLVREYEEFISTALFEGRNVVLTPHQKDGVVKVKIGKEAQRAIHLLGDGIQAAIIMSFLPFIYRQEAAFFFIEEPEMFMHPGLQRKLLNFYSSLENHLFFLTTHSNHFLDVTIDIRRVAIFTFRKSGDPADQKFIVESVDSGHESSLELLGVRNSSVFLVNATVWVEGITDRWYLRRMLTSYIDYLKKTDRLILDIEEDVHYSFVEYGGANITHWSFLDEEEHPIEVERLCAKAILVVDGDGEAKLKRKAALEALLGERLILLMCREIENLLPYQVIKEVVLSYEKEPKPAISDFDYESYRNEYLGKFIDEQMLNNKPSRKNGYQDRSSGKVGSGTIKGKRDFCERAVVRIQYSELPAQTQEVVQKIYTFICDRNA
jgi:hypothetical protein